MSKVIVLDWGIYSHRAIFATVNNPKIPATYTCLSMILGNLKRIGVDPDDKIIVAVDSRGSWRKQLEKDYKGDRKQKRKESPIDWDSEYRKMGELLNTLDSATDWNIVKIDHCLVGNTVIKTKGKDKYLSSLKKGEEVLTYNFKKHKFEYNKILNTFKNKTNEFYNLYFNETEKVLKITGEHKVYTSRKWIKAKHLKIDDIIYSYTDYEMEKTEMKRIGYLCGMLLGDGYIYRNNSKKTQLLKIQLTDKKIIEYIQKMIFELFGRKYKIAEHSFSNPKWQKTYALTITSQRIIKYILDKIHNYPNDLDFKKGFLTGFYEAEGTFLKKKGYRYGLIRIPNTKKQYIDYIAKILDELKVEYRRYKFKSKG